MSSRSSIFIKNIDDNTKIIMAFLAVAGLGLIIYSLSGNKSCGCGMKEPYIQEFSGNNPNYNTSPSSYRLYVNGQNDTSRNRCQLYKGYNNSSFESFEYPQVTDFKLCPHNFRQYGVASCDQGSVM